MALPEGLYYSLPKAIKKINADLGTDMDIEDLLHFAAMGKLELCFRLKTTSNDFYGNSSEIDHGHVLNFYPQNDDEFDELINFFDAYDKLLFKSWISTSNGTLTLYGLEHFREYPHIVANSLAVRSIDMLLAIPPLEFDDVESDGSFTFFSARLPRTTPLIVDDKKLQIDTYIGLDDEVTVPFIDMFITNEELELFKSNDEQFNNNSQNNETSCLKESKSGRPSNTFQEVILAIAKATREVYPTCTGKSLARKIHQFLANEDKAPSLGTIEQNISKGLISPEEKDTKLNYGLIIPDEFQYIKNK